MSERCDICGTLTGEHWKHLHALDDRVAKLEANALHDHKCRVQRGGACNCFQSAKDSVRAETDPATPDAVGAAKEPSTAPDLGTSQVRAEAPSGVAAGGVDWSRFVPTEEIPEDMDKAAYEELRRGDVFASWDLLHGGTVSTCEGIDRAHRLAGEGCWWQRRIRLIRHADGSWADGYGPDGPMTSVAGNRCSEGLAHCQNEACRTAGAIPDGYRLGDGWQEQNTFGNGGPCDLCRATPGIILKNDGIYSIPRLCRACAVDMGALVKVEQAAEPSGNPGQLPTCSNPDRWCERRYDQAGCFCQHRRDNATAADEPAGEPAKPVEGFVFESKACAPGGGFEVNSPKPAEPSGSPGQCKPWCGTGECPADVAHWGEETWCSKECARVCRKPENKEAQGAAVAKPVEPGRPLSGVYPSEHECHSDLRCSVCNKRYIAALEARLADLTKRLAEAEANAAEGMRSVASLGAVLAEKDKRLAEAERERDAISGEFRKLFDRSDARVEEERARCLARVKVEFKRNEVGPALTFQQTSDALLTRVLDAIRSGAPEPTVGET